MEKRDRRGGMKGTAKEEVEEDDAGGEEGWWEVTEGSRTSCVEKVAEDVRGVC